ncbi:hypothetical protein IC582_023226 [Cucumis melo]
MVERRIRIWVVSVFLLLVLSFLLLLKTKTHNKKLPPTPPKLSLLGHLHLLGPLPHRSLWKLSRKYGPIMLLKLGSLPTLIISSSAAPATCCGRPLLTASARFSYNFLDIGLSLYIGGKFSFYLIREEEVALLLKLISQSSSLGIPVDLSEESYTLAAKIITPIAFKKRFRRGELENMEIFSSLIRKAIVALGSFSMTDFFPSVGWR